VSVSDLKAQLADIPGIQGLTMTTVAGRDNYGFDGLLISVDPTMGQDEVAAQIRAAVSARRPRPPIVNFTTETPPGKSMAATGSFAASLRALMDEARSGLEQARSDGRARVGEAVGKLHEAKVATAHVAGSMAKTIEDEASAVMAELGQISNSLGGENG
jgi:hypothetical protein